MTRFLFGTLAATALASFTLTATVASFSPTSAVVTTYYVSASGNDTNPGTSAAPFATIQKGANVALPGDTIIVRPGVYAGAKFSRSGTAGSPIVLRGEAGAIVQSPGPNNSNNDNIWIRNASWVTIERLEVRNAPRAGIAVQAEPDAESHGIVIRDNFAHDNGRWGVFTAYSEGLLIAGNETSYSGAEHGIYVSNSADNPVIRQNRAHHNHASGIQINADPILDGDGIISNALLELNVCYENGVGGGAAINLASVTNSRIVNNLLYDNHASGIAGWDDGAGSQWGTHHNQFLHNTIVQASDGRFAVSLQNGSSSNMLLNNVLLHPGSRGSIDLDSSSEAGLSSDYNAIVDRFALDENFITAAQWRARGHEAHSIIASTAALFINAGADDYHLRSGSPAVDAANGTAGVVEDIEHVRRPQGPGFDMGAYELKREADTPGVYIGATAAWFLRNSSAPGAADIVFSYGPSGASFTPIKGDWDGDGDDTPGVYDPVRSVFFLKNTSGNGSADFQFSFGAAGSGMVPVCGDWNGDGTDSIGLYNPASGAFFLKNANTGGSADVALSFGAGGGGYKPVAGDWNGDALDTIGLYNPATAVFFLKNSHTNGPADIVFGYGSPNAAPLAGDWNGDGADTVGVYVGLTGAWFLRNANSGGAADLTFRYGPTGAVAVVGDWDGL